MNAFPTPTIDAEQHSNALLDSIKNQIATSNGKISFRDYMDLALYAPGLGYYSAGAKKFGPEGDFITAPEISSLFAVTLLPTWLHVRQELPTAAILELGAGSGKLCVDLLQALDKQNCLPEKYYILEVSADLKHRQAEYIKANIPHLANKIEWLNSIENFTFSGLVIGNEILDAMPVHKFRIHKGILEEYFVTMANDQLVECLDSPTAIVNDHLDKEQFFENNDYTSEINTEMNPFFKSLFQCIEKGLLLFFDYGFPANEYYHPSRSMGTLMCHYRHLSHGDFFLYPGLQDITAHVNFSLVAKAADMAGFDILGYTTQAAFLLHNNILEYVQTIKDKQAIQLLTSPAEMGELCKVITLGKNCNYNDTIPYNMLYKL